MNEDVTVSSELQQQQNSPSLLAMIPQQQQQQNNNKNKTVVKSGELFLSIVSAGERERWRSRFFTLYTDGELICGLSADPTVPILESIDLKQCISINMSDDVFCLGFSNRSCFFRAANQQETKRWFLLLSEFFNNGPAAMLQRASKRVRLLLPAGTPGSGSQRPSSYNEQDNQQGIICDTNNNNNKIMENNARIGNSCNNNNNNNSATLAQTFRNNQPVEIVRNQQQLAVTASPKRSDSFTTAVLGLTQQQQQQHPQQQPTIPENSAATEPQDQNWVKKLQLFVDRNHQQQQQQQQQQQITTAAQLAMKSKQPALPQKPSSIRTVTVFKADWVMLKHSNNINNQPPPPQQTQQPQKNNSLAASSWSRCWLELTTNNEGVYRLSAYRSPDDRGLIDERVFGGRSSGELKVTTGKAGQLYTISVESPDQTALIFAGLSQNVANDWLGVLEKCCEQNQQYFFDAQQTPKLATRTQDQNVLRKQVIDFLDGPKPIMMTHFQKKQTTATPAADHHHKYYNHHFRDLNNGFYGVAEGQNNLLLANSAHLSSSEPSLLDRLGAPIISNMDHFLKQQQQQQQQNTGDLTPKLNMKQNSSSSSTKTLIAGAERAAFQLLESEVGSLKTRLELAAEEIAKLTDANAALTKQMTSLQRCQQESYSEIVKESQRYLEQIAEMHADMDSQSHFYELQIQAANRNLKQANFRLKFVLELVDILKGSVDSNEQVNVAQKVAEIVRQYQESSCCLAGSRDSEDSGLVDQQQQAQLLGGDSKMWFGQVGHKFQTIIASAMTAKTTATYEATVKRLENDNKTVRDEAATLSASVVELREMIREKLSECDELSAQNYRLQAELERTQDALSSEIRRNSSKQSKFNRLEGCVEEQRERIRALETQAERSRFMVKKMEASLDARTHQITYLKRMVTHLNPAAPVTEIQPDVKSPTVSENLAADQGYIALFLKYSAAVEQLERLKNERFIHAAQETNQQQQHQDGGGGEFIPPLPSNQQANSPPSTTPLVISTCLREMRAAVDRLQASSLNSPTVGELSSCLARLSSVVTEQAEAFETIQTWCETVRRRQKSLEDSYQARLGLLLERLAEQQHFESTKQQIEPPIQPQIAYETFSSSNNNKAKSSSQCSSEMAKLIAWLQLMVLKELRDDSTSGGNNGGGGGGNNNSSSAPEQREEQAAAKSERQRLLWQANRSLQLALPLLTPDNEPDFKQFLANLVVLIEGCGLLPPEASVTCALDQTSNVCSPTTASSSLELLPSSLFFTSAVETQKTATVVPCRDAILSRPTDLNCYSLSIAYLESTRSSVMPGLRPFVDALINFAKSQQQLNQNHECCLLVSNISEQQSAAAAGGGTIVGNCLSSLITGQQQPPLQYQANKQQQQVQQQLLNNKCLDLVVENSRKVVMTTITAKNSKKTKKNNGGGSVITSSTCCNNKNSMKMSTPCLLTAVSSSSEKTTTGSLKFVKKSDNNNNKSTKTVSPDDALSICEVVALSPPYSSSGGGSHNRIIIGDNNNNCRNNNNNNNTNQMIVMMRKTPPPPNSSSSRAHLSTSCEYLHTKAEIFDI